MRRAKRAPAPRIAGWFAASTGKQARFVGCEKPKAAPDRGLHIKNSYASETPVTDGERVYAFFGNVGVFCYDMNGEPLWTKRIESNPTMFTWGTASSPVLYKGRLYVLVDNEKQSYLTALDAKTGKETWRVDRNEKTSWATPFVWENELRTELITCGKTKIRSYDLNGKLLWELGGMSSLVIPTPLTKFGLLFLSSGYVNDKAQPIFVANPGLQETSLSEINHQRLPCLEP